VTFNRRPTVACAACGRRKRLTDGGKMPSHHPPGKPGLKCYETAYTLARPERKPAKPRKRIPAQNRKRSAQQRLYDFGPQAEWMRDLPCATCGARPPSEPSHVKTRNAGGTRDDMIPQCTDCHERFHAGRETFAASIGKSVDDLVALAADYAQRWLGLLPQVRTQYELLFCQRWPAAGRLFRERGYG
jgi:hypothetical protein